MSITLVDCDFVVTGGGVLERASVAIQDGEVKWVGEGSPEGDELDCRGKVVIPALTNSHTHLGMWYLRGYSDDRELGDWLRDVWRAEGRASRELVDLSSEASLIESLSRGTGLVVDMYFNPWVLPELSGRYGVRTAGGPVFMDNVKDPDEVERESRAHVPTELFTPVINVHSLYTASTETLERASGLSRETGRKVFIHLSETRGEFYQLRKNTGKFPLEYLASLVGDLREWRLVHMGWATSWEFDRVVRDGAGVVHCPTSNMKLATAGFLPSYELISRGATLALGTDGPASNNSLDMFREMKEAVLLSRNNYWDLRLKAHHALTMGTSGYRLLGIRGGEISPGWVGDVITLDSQDLRPLSKERVLSAIVYTATGEAVSEVVIGGKLVYRRGMYRKRYRKIGDRVQEILSGMGL